MFLKSRKLCTHSKNTVDHNLQQSWKLGISGNCHWCHRTRWHAQDTWAFRTSTGAKSCNSAQANSSRTTLHTQFLNSFSVTASWKPHISQDSYSYSWSHDSGFEIMEPTSILLKKEADKIGGRDTRSPNKAERGEHCWRPGAKNTEQAKSWVPRSVSFTEMGINFVLSKESKLRWAREEISSWVPVLLALTLWSDRRPIFMD